MLGAPPRKAYEDPLITPIPDDATDELRRALAPEGEEVTVRIETDISRLLLFGARWLIVTRNHIRIVDPDDEDPLVIPVDDVKTARVEGLIGGARLIVERKSPEGQETPDDVVLYASSTHHAALYDIAERIDQLIKGEALRTPKERERHRCPSCDRYIPDKTATCPFCIDKLETVKKIFRLLKPHRKGVAILFGFMVVGLGIDLIPPWIVGNMIDEVFVEGGNYDMLLFYVGGIIGIKVITTLMGHVKGILGTKFGSHMTADVRVTLIRALMRHPLAYYDESQAGLLMQRLTTDAGRLQGLLSNDAPALFINTAMLVGVLCFLFYKNWYLTIWAFLPLPFLFIRTKNNWRPMNRMWERVTLMWARLSVHLGESLAGVRVVKAFAQEPQESAKFYENNKKVFDRNLSADLKGYVFFSSISIVMTLGSTASWLVGGRQVIRGEISLGELTVLVAYLWMLYSPLTWFSQTTNSMSQALTSSERLFDILDVAQSEGFDNPDAQRMPRIEGRITFKDVNFAYDPEHPVLTGVDLDVKPGEVIGVVGRSGAGKTTLVNLVGRFYEVKVGQILVDGVDIRKVDLGDLRSQIGIVLQDSALFNMTIAENIKYGRPEATFEEIVEAARVAEAHSFIVQKAEGYDTMVGERGCCLSGGEKQRVAIARAILRDPRILILDEATSSLDSHTERAIQKALRKVSIGRTTFIVAHRLSTLRHAHRICVFEKGKIAEVGTHDELMEARGIFYDMVTAQDDPDAPLVQ